MGRKLSIGVLKTFPIYSNTTKNVSVTSSNIASVFKVSNGSNYYFAGSGSTFTTNNGGVASSTATTTLTALYDMTVSFTYSYASEANYDKFTLTFNGTTIESAVSGTATTKTYSGTLPKGKTIEFKYAKDGSQDSNGDKCTFSSMTVSYVERTQTGSENKSVASKGKKAWIGISNKARKIKKMWVGDANGKARLFFSGFDKKFVWATYDWTSYAVQVSSSLDGNTWSGITNVTTKNEIARMSDSSPITCGNERYVFTDFYGEVVYSSPDGVNFTKVSVASFKPTSGYQMHQLSFIDDKFYLVYSGYISGYNGFRIITSVDGYTWTKLTEFWKLPLPDNPSAYSSVSESFMQFKFIKGTYEGVANRFVIFPKEPSYDYYVCPIWSDDGITFHYTYHGESTLNIFYERRAFRTSKGAIGRPYGGIISGNSQTYFTIADVCSVNIPWVDTSTEGYYTSISFHEVIQHPSDSNALLIFVSYYDYNGYLPTLYKVFKCPHSGGTATQVYASTDFPFNSYGEIWGHYLTNGKHTRIALPFSVSGGTAVGTSADGATWTFSRRTTSATIVSRSAVYD